MYENGAIAREAGIECQDRRDGMDLHHRDEPDIEGGAADRLVRDDEPTPYRVECGFVAAQQLKALFDLGRGGLRGGDRQPKPVRRRRRWARQNRPQFGNALRRDREPAASAMQPHEAGENGLLPRHHRRSATHDNEGRQIGL
jgi:hypothetical protein